MDFLDAAFGKRIRCVTDLKFPKMSFNMTFPFGFVARLLYLLALKELKKP
ncbi:hypothetical protein [Niastella vici]|nr:hypothetical protein [Niastella vici]